MLNNKNLYPTPDWLIDKMLSKVELRSIRNILEPSAGLGNIIERIKGRLGEQNMQYCDIDAIEIDNINLTPILKSKNIRVIHDNFLTFQSSKSYGAIIMNPPFDNGAKHLLKAIEIQEKNGGQIVCLLNAETINNPYSNDRKYLIDQLDKYNADIEYVENGFADADRKTNVETALIHINIPKITQESVIIEHLKKEEEYKQQKHSQNQIVHGDFLQQIIAKYNFEINAGVKLINEYESIRPMLSRSFDDAWTILELSIYDKNDRSGDPLVNKFIKAVRYKYWSQLFQSKEFGQLFTSDLKDKYMNKLDDLKNYDFSEYNINQIKLDMQDLLHDSLHDTIYKLFDKLISHAHWHGYEGNIHYYNGWKTNKAEKINDKKNIIPLSGYGFWGDRFYPTDYKFVEQIQDIHKVFTYLDNGNTTFTDNLRDVLKEAQDKGQTKDIDLGYFSITCFKKGTTHFKWNRPDLIQKLNILGSQNKGWLPPDYGKKRYKDMSNKEKDVIDSFQGKESYEKVFNDRQFYLGVGSNLLAITG